MDIFKDFEASRRERATGREPIRFSIGGETFACVPVMPGGPVLDLIAGTPNVYTAYRRFLEAALRTDDGTDDQASSADRFTNMLYRDEGPIDADAIIEIVDWIAEVYSGRPTPRSTDSSDGPPSDGAPGKVVSLSKGTVTQVEASTG